jgi:hypothetical protein
LRPPSWYRGHISCDQMVISSIIFQFTGVSIIPAPAPAENPIKISKNVLLSNFIDLPLRISA